MRDKENGPKSHNCSLVITSFMLLVYFVVLVCWVFGCFGFFLEEGGWRKREDKDRLGFFVCLLWGFCFALVFRPPQKEQKCSAIRLQTAVESDK